MALPAPARGFRAGVLSLLYSSDHSASSFLEAFCLFRLRRRRCCCRHCRLPTLLPRFGFTRSALLRATPAPNFSFHSSCPLMVSPSSFIRLPTPFSPCTLVAPPSSSSPRASRFLSSRRHPRTPLVSPRTNFTLLTRHRRSFLRVTHPCAEVVEWRESAPRSFANVRRETLNVANFARTYVPASSRRRRARDHPLALMIVKELRSALTAPLPLSLYGVFSPPSFSRQFRISHGSLVPISLPPRALNLFLRASSLALSLSFSLVRVITRRFQPQRSHLNEFSRVPSGFPGSLIFCELISDV